MRWNSLFVLMMATIGEILKKAREARKLSLDSVYQATRINPRILLALEADEFDKLAGTLYVKSFLKKYAEFLGLNSSEVVNSYLALNPPRPPSTPAVTPQKEAGFGSVSKIRAALFILAGFISLFIILFLLRLLIRPERDYSRVRAEKKTVKVTSPEVFSIPRAEELVLKIKAQKETWIQLKSDGRVVFQHILSAGREESWKAKNNFELWVGDAGNLTLLLNGKPLGSLGRGVKRGIVIDHSGLQMK